MTTRFWYSVFVILNFVVLIYLFILFLSSLFIFKRSFWCSFAIVQICLFKLLFDYSLLIFYHFKVSILKFSTGTSTEFIKITSPSKSKKFKFTMSFGFLVLILTAKCSVFRSWSESVRETFIQFEESLIFFYFLIWSRFMTPRFLCIFPSITASDASQSLQVMNFRGFYF